MKQGGNKYIQSCVQDGLSPDDWLQYNWREGASQPSRMNGRIFLYYYYYWRAGASQPSRMNGRIYAAPNFTNVSSILHSTTHPNVYVFRSSRL